MPPLPVKLKLKRLLRRLIGLMVLLAVVILAPSFYVRQSGIRHILPRHEVPKAQTAIVLGAGVTPKGNLSSVLQDRVNTSIELYKTGKVKKLLMTGDHGRINYDEVNAMRKFAEKRGVPTQDVFMDHAGFCTYDSMYRAKAIFQVRSAVIVTQKFHLPRAVYLARAQGIDATGVSADKQRYKGALMLEAREIPARLQDFIRANILHPKPKYLGDTIPITGDGRQTHD